MEVSRERGFFWKGHWDTVACPRKGGPAIPTPPAPTYLDTGLRRYKEPNPTVGNSLASTWSSGSSTHKACGSLWALAFSPVKRPLPFEGRVRDYKAYSKPSMGLPCWLCGKESACLQCRRCEFNPWVRKIPLRRKWQPSPVFLPGKFMDRGVWQAIVHGAAKEVGRTDN